MKGRQTDIQTDSERSSYNSQQRATALPPSEEQREGHGKRQNPETPSPMSCELLGASEIE